MAGTRLTIPDALTVRVDADAMRAMVTDLFGASGMPADHARQAANVLIWADLRGIDTHGVSNMMAVYLRGLKDGTINPNPEWKFVRESDGTAHIDSDRGLGLVVGPAAMELAIEKARRTGIGCVVVGNGRHFGAAGYHAALALEHDMIGMAMTVGGLLVAPTAGSRAMVGLNPIAFAAPAGREAPFIFDASMSSVAGNKIRLIRRLGTKVAPGWIADMEGTPIMDESPVPDQFMMLPLGATRDIGSHKGYSLAVMIDILSGMLAGEGSILQSSPRGTASHQFLAYRIDAFTDVRGFKNQMDSYLKALRETAPAPGEERVIYAGLDFAETLQERHENGVPYHREVAEQFKSWAAEFGVTDRLPAL